jgi:hypothetical protein
MSSGGVPYVVNVTQPGHPLFPGYVARVVSDYYANNIGEGTGRLQNPLNPLSIFINGVWYRQTEEAIAACTCLNLSADR